MKERRRKPSKNRQFEPILYGWRQGVKHYFIDQRNQTDVWEIDRHIKNDLHPTMKPVALCSKAIFNNSSPGDIVLDPFGGSGSTLIAAEKLKIFKPMELKPKVTEESVKQSMGD